MGFAVRLILNLILTVLIELAASMLLGVRDNRKLPAIALVNILTNVPANLLSKVFLRPEALAAYASRSASPRLWLASPQFWLFFLAAEVLIWLVEAFLYLRLVKELPLHPLLFSLILNAASAGCGILLMALGI